MSYVNIRFVKNGYVAGTSLDIGYVDKEYAFESAEGVAKWLESYLKDQERSIMVYEASITACSDIDGKPRVHRP